MSKNQSPGDPKPLVTSQPSPESLSSKLHYIRSSRRENRGKQRRNPIERNVTFLKNTTSFSFFPFPHFRASNLGKIDGNCFGEIVASSAVLNHPIDCENLVKNCLNNIWAKFWKYWTGKKSVTRTKLDFLFESANTFCLKSQALKLVQNLRQS